jgi:hypothetical protein
MTLYEFNVLDEMEQAEAVWAGVFVADREDEQHRILLYQIDSFYVEVYYHKQHNVLIRFQSFSSINQLDPYLDKIDLRGKF